MEEIKLRIQRNENIQELIVEFLDSNPIEMLQNESHLIANIFNSTQEDLKLFLIARGIDCREIDLEKQGFLVQSQLIRKNPTIDWFFISYFYYSKFNSYLARTLEYSEELVVALALMLFDGMPVIQEVSRIHSQIQRADLQLLLQIAIWAKEIDYSIWNGSTISKNSPKIDCARSGDPIMFILKQLTNSNLNIDLISHSSLKTLFSLAKVVMERNEVYLQQIISNIELYSDPLMILNVVEKLIENDIMQPFSVFPLLCKIRNPHVTARVFKMVEYIYTKKDYTQVIIGLEIAYECWKVDKRLWITFQNGIFQINDRLKYENRNRFVDAVEAKNEADLQLYFDSILLGICTNDPFNAGNSILPMVAANMKERNLQYDSFMKLVEEGVTTVQAAWDIVLRSLISIEHDPHILKYFIDFFEIFGTQIAHLDELNEKTVRFRDEIIEFIVQLLQHPNLQVRKGAYNVLPLFEIQLEKDDFSNCVDEIAGFLVKKIEKEIQDMPRPVFKGFATQQGGQTVKQAKSKVVENLAKEYTNEITATAFAPAVLYSNQKLRLFDTKSDAQWLADLSRNLFNPKEITDILDGWYWNWCNLLKPQNDVISVALLLIDNMKQALKNEDIPSVMAGILLSLTGLAISAIDYGINAEVIFPTLKIYTNHSFLAVREVSSFCIVILCSYSLNIELLEMVWENPIDSDIGGLTSAKIVEIAMLPKSKCSISIFFKRNFANSGWKTIGAAKGYATLFAARRKHITPTQDEIDILEFCTDFLKGFIENGDASQLEASLWTVAYCSTSNNTRELLKEVVEKTKNTDMQPISEFANYIYSLRMQIVSLENIISITTAILCESNMAHSLSACMVIRNLIPKTNSAWLHTTLSHDFPTIDSRLMINLRNTFANIRYSDLDSMRSLCWLISELNINIGSENAAKNETDYKRFDPNSYFYRSWELLQQGIAEENSKTAWELLEKVIFNVHVTYPVVEWMNIYQFVVKSGDTNGFQLFVQFLKNQGSPNCASTVIKLMGKILIDNLTSPKLDSWLTNYFDIFLVYLRLGGIGQPKDSVTLIAPSEIRKIAVAVLPEIMKKRTALFHLESLERLITKQSCQSLQFTSLCGVILNLIETLNISDAHMARLGEVLIKCLDNRYSDSIKKLAGMVEQGTCTSSLWILRFICCTKDGKVYLPQLVNMVEEMVASRSNLSTLLLLVLLTTVSDWQGKIRIVQWLSKFLDLVIGRLGRGDKLGARYLWNYMVLPCAAVRKMDKFCNFDHLDWKLIQGMGVYQLREILSELKAQSDPQSVKDYETLTSRLKSIQNSAEKEFGRVPVSSK